MMPFSEPRAPLAVSSAAPLTSLSAGEMALRIRRGELRSQDLVEAHIERILRLDPLINAVVTRDFENARRAAQQADRQLASASSSVDRLPALFGLPMTVKDTYATKGLRTTFAMPRMLQHEPKEDAELVRRLKAAGAIILGKTNVPLAAFDWQCKHPSFGRTNNPWNLGHTPGGSSGGSAAALAAGFTPLEIGSDVAGSIRVPAHFCGVVGLRPTEVALPDAGHAKVPGYADTVKHLAVCGPMARTVADLRLLLNVLWDPELARPGATPAFAQTPQPSREARTLRVAWSGSWAQEALDRATTETLHTTVRKLSRAGHQVEEAAPVALDPEEALKVWGLILGHEMISAPSWLLRSAPLKLFYALNPFRFVFGKGLFARALAAGFACSSTAYERALQRRAELMAEMDRFLTRFDVWVTPNTSTPAFSHRPIGSPLTVDDVELSYTAANGSWQVPLTTYAHPCLSLPAGTSTDGLPIGLQLHAKRWSDFALLDTAAVVEALVPRAAGQVAPLS